jgi:DNA repair protein RAD50
MIKGNVTLDMRGRCSAGQKVLASLIIRLALAATLGGACGILALDEPTTNVSKSDNRLVGQRGAIIADRIKEANLQLIIITHDEEFLERLGNSDYADHYWRITKDASGRSQIDRKSMFKKRKDEDE